MNCNDFNVELYERIPQPGTPGSNPPTGFKTRIPARLQMFQRNWSVARVRMRLSLVNCCNAPISPPVRMIATNSFGCNCSVTNLRNCFRTWYMLSADRPRSSTTNAIVRRASFGLIGPKGTTGATFFTSLVGGWGVAPETLEMYAKLVIV